MTATITLSEYDVAMLVVLRAELAKKIWLAKTSQAFAKGTNKGTVSSRQAQLRVISEILRQTEGK